MARKDHQEIQENQVRKYVLIFFTVYEMLFRSEIIRPSSTAEGIHSNLLGLLSLIRI